MKITFSNQAFQDFLAWQAEDLEIFARLVRIIQETLRNPFEGIGKPEPLKGNLKGYWSKRITQEHRFVYKVEGKEDTQTLFIISCKGHY
jgi:toxin YoeB